MLVNTAPTDCLCPQAHDSQQLRGAGGALPRRQASRPDLLAEARAQFNGLISASSCLAVRPVPGTV
jgi:hypothetical protein